MGPARPDKVFLRGLRYYLAAMPLIWAGGLAYQFLLRAAGTPVDLQPVVHIIRAAEHPGWMAYFILLAVVVGPLFEELFFRGIAFPAAARYLGVPWAIAAVSAAFALLHMHGPTLVPLFIVSAAFCLGYWRTGSLWVSIVMHACFNGVNLALLLGSG